MAAELCKLCLWGENESLFMFFHFLVSFSDSE